jgi:hypothetical protein
VLAKMWWKKYPRTLPVGMQASAITLEKKYGGFLKIWTQICLMISNPTPGDILKEMRHSLFQKHLHIHVYYSAIHNSQVMEIAPLLMNGLRKCVTSTQWSFTQPWRRIKSYHSQVNESNRRTSFWVRLARLRRPKSYVLPHMQTLVSLICRL